MAFVARRDLNVWRGCVLCVMLIAVGLSFVGSGAVAAAVEGSRFVPVSPQRILDSRPGLGPVDDGIVGAVPAGGSITVRVTDRGGVPSAGVTAVVLNVTVTEALGAGYVQVFPTGLATLGASSNLNVEYAGQTIANQVTVPVGVGGEVSIFLPAGGQVLADVFGYYTPSSASTDGRYTPLQAPTPRRVLDTRDPLQVPIANPGNAVDCGHFATWDEARRWFWTYHRWGDPAFLDGNGDGIPCESLPGTKTASPPVDLFKVPAGGTVRIPVLTGTALPGGVAAAGQASAVVANVTVTEASGVGFWQVLPTGGAALGSSSNLNINNVGQTISNQVIVPIGADGTITIFAQGGGHVIVDIAGVFTGTSSPSSTAGLFVAVTPNRLVDTRDPSNTPIVGPLPAGGQLTVQTANRFGIPAGASAVSLNATITAATAPGFVQVFPTGGAVPGASSNINVEHVGQTIPNAAYATVDGNGQFTMFTQTGGQLIADVAGWFTGNTPPAGSIAATTVLASLTVTPEYTGPLVYDRALFPHWITGPNGCDTRQQVLIRNSITPAQVDPFGCAVVAGDWYSPYDGATWTSPADLDIDHVVALSEAWDSGAYAWDTQRRTNYANDLSDQRSLIAVTSSVNASKGDSDPAGWLPLNNADICRYIGAWISIKARWNLTIDAVEKSTLRNLLGGTCAGLAIAPWVATP